MICKFEELYQQEAQGQRARYQALREGFKAQFGSDEGGEYFSAPGRSEIGGNHTDHQHGRVLAAAVNLDIAAYARKTDNGRAVLKSAEYTKMDDIDISDLDMKEEEKDTSAALLRGICARCVQLGYKVGGFEAYTLSLIHIYQKENRQNQQHHWTSGGFARLPRRETAPFNAREEQKKPSLERRLRPGSAWRRRRDLNPCAGFPTYSLSLIHI